MQVFEQFRTVSVDDIDHLNHVNNIRYLEWIQGIARAHWTSITTDQQRQSNVWVVLRHEIDYKGQATLGDVITAKTRVGDSSGFTSERFIEFYLEDKLIVKAKTTWAMLYRKNYKPARIREDVLQVLTPKS